ncbi:MAG: hypothetical protein WAM18_03940, partial [Halobacillus sp.]
DKGEDQGKGNEDKEDKKDKGKGDKDHKDKDNEGKKDKEQEKEDKYTWVKSWIYSVWNKYFSNYFN